MDKYWHDRTKLVHAGVRRSQFGETAEALFLTQGYVYPDAETAAARFRGGPAERPEGAAKDGAQNGAQKGTVEEAEGFIYSRYANPTVRMFEERMAALEGTEDGFATATGMAAVNGALFSQLRAGDHIVSARALFGSCLYIVETLLPRFGVEVTLVDGTDIAAWAGAIRADTKLVFFEALSNPTLEVVDIAAVAELAHARGAKVVVDNVFATPVFQRSTALGADIVVYSATKHIDGQGRCLGGVVLASAAFIRQVFEPYLKHTGGSLSPFNAWVMLKGLETMSLRCTAQAASAQMIAEALIGHPAVRKVLYPGLPTHPQHACAARQMRAFGTVLSVEIAGGQAGAFRFLNALRLWLISNNLGDAKSLVTHPATTTHQRLGEAARAALGITPGLVRLSVGLEDSGDLLGDLERALDSV
ncbi:MAG: aminotransferase class V-fold PLP-dependent enzyme [Pseudomonadota bacterium]